MTSIQKLLDIMARLRDPEDGCPWDLEQDFSSISPFTIEEAYEVDEAIRSGDREALRDELGDLLFQVVFQARIAEEEGAFDFGGVAEAICDKLIRRHPHVFADAEAPDSLAGQTASWESIKAAERAAAAAALGKPEEEAQDPFAGIARNLPALVRSAKLAGRWAQLESEDSPRAEAEAEGAEGDDSVQPGLNELLGATAEAQSVLAAAGGRVPRKTALTLVGEGLRSWAVLARGLGVDPEQALREADDARVEGYRRREATRNQP